MAILIDYSQVAISCLMAQIKDGDDIDENLIRHMILNTLRSLIVQFKRKYGEIVVCCDSKQYWRRDYFPFYKSNRKKDREASKLDWKLIFNTLDALKGELKEYFPYKVIEVETAEADDIIAILAGRISPHEDVLILSSDKDFVQLQKYKGVSQYSPIMKKFISSEKPAEFLQELILMGDRGDGVPNFMSPDNTFALGIRQKRVNKKKLVDWVKMDASEFCNSEMLRNYKRNQMMIDLNYIPEKIQQEIVTTYENCDIKSKMSRQRLLNYFIEKRLSKLTNVLDEF